MSEEYSSILSDYESVKADEKLSKVIKVLKKKREILVFDEREVFLGYLTQRYLTRQSRIQADTKVSNLMKKVTTVSQNSSLDSVASVILSTKIQSAPVEEDGKIIGVFKDIDVIRLSAELFKDQKVREVMTRNPICVTPDTPVSRLIAISRTNNISRSPVIDESNKLIGIVSPHDVSELLLTKLPGQTRGDRAAAQIDILSSPVSEIMTKNVVVCKGDELVLETISKLYKTDHKALVVIDNDNHPIGILTTTDLLETVSKPPQEEGYYVRVIGDVDDADMDSVIEMGVDLVKKFASVIGTSGLLYIHSKAVPKKKFRGFILYQIRLRVSTDKGNTYVAHSEGYGVFSALAVAVDRMEREIITERELEIQQIQSSESERYILEDLEELDL
ncbi:MAG: CBS domain-containing protein [Asgard group archaeon]|nr:CBS domain-containing protein [Asgard group archaeon]